MRPGLLQHRKFARLARLVGNDATALGSLEMLWNACYEAGDDVLGDAGDVEHMARWRGKAGVLVSALVESGFVDVDDAGEHSVHDLWDHAPRYVQKRAEREQERRNKGTTLAEVRSSAGRKGAQQVASKRAANGQQVDDKLAATEQQTDALPAPSSQLPSPSTQHPAPSTIPEETCAAGAGTHEPHPSWTRRADEHIAASNSPDHAAFIAAFQAAYQEATGSKPTWGAKEGAMVKRLLKAHGREELERRMRVMFDWPAGMFPVTTPPTLAMLAQHVDTFVALPARRANGVGLTADEIRAGAEELRRMGL